MCHRHDSFDREALPREPLVLGHDGEHEPGASGVAGQIAKVEVAVGDAALLEVHDGQ